MENIQKYISRLLFLHDCVIIPGFGGFVSNYKSATQNELNNTFNPPHKAIVFNKNLTYNDGLLVNYLAKNMGLSYHQANELVDTEVQRAWLELEKTNKLVIEGIGFFSYDKNGLLLYTALITENFLTESYGLSSFRFPPLNYHKPTYHTLPHKIDQAMSPGLKQTLKWAAIAVPIIGVFSLLPIYKSQHNQTAGITIINSEQAYKPIEQTHSASGSEVGVDSAIVQATDKRTALFYTEPEKTSTVNYEKTAKRFYIIGGSYKDDAHAQEQASTYRSKGYDAEVIQADELFRVSLCSFDSKVNALHELRRIRNKEQNDNVWIYAQK